MNLRPYQSRVVTTTRNEIKNGCKKVLIVLSTGAGKTAILFDIARRAAEKGHKILMLVHRRDLAFQTVAKFKEYGLDTGLIMAGAKPNFDKPVQIASVWTYDRRLRLNTKEFNRFYVKASLVLIDEAHRSLSKVYQNVVNSYQDKIIIGVTATPCLSSGVGMGNMYDSLIDEIPITKLIQDKYLVPCIYYGGSAVDTKGMHTVGGDWNTSELGKKSDKTKLIGDITKNWLRLAYDRQTILFAVNRKHGKHLLEAFVNKGISAAYLDAHSLDEERAKVLSQYNNKEIQVIINVALFQEFLDAPITDCIDIARATKSMGLFRQMVGRGLRPYPDKKNCMVIDHGNCIVGQNLGFIEDEITWTLSGKALAWKKKKKTVKEKTIMTCQECKTLFTGHICPQCGLEVKGYGKKIATIEKKLHQLVRHKKDIKKKKVFTKAEKQEFYGMLKWEQIEKKYNRGWIAHQYKNKFGVWPINLKGTPEAIPDKAFSNFLTWQRIKFFKGKGKGIAKQYSSTIKGWK